MLADLALSQIFLGTEVNIQAEGSRLSPLRTATLTPLEVRSKRSREVKNLFRAAGVGSEFGQFRKQMLGPEATSSPFKSLLLRRSRVLEMLLL